MRPTNDFSVDDGRRSIMVDLPLTKPDYAEQDFERLRHESQHQKPTVMKCVNAIREGRRLW